MIHVKKPINTIEVVKIQNPETIKFIKTRAIECYNMIESNWNNNLTKAKDDFQKLSWIRRNFAFLFAPKHLAAIAKAELEYGLKSCLQFGICRKFIQQSKYRTTFFLSKNDLVYLWVPELWDKYSKMFIPVVEKVF